MGVPWTGKLGTLVPAVLGVRPAGERGKHTKRGLFGEMCRLGIARSLAVLFIWGSDLFGPKGTSLTLGHGRQTFFLPRRTLWVKWDRRILCCPREWVRKLLYFVVQKRKTVKQKTNNPFYCSRRTDRLRISYDNIFNHKGLSTIRYLPSLPEDLHSANTLSYLLCASLVL